VRGNPLALGQVRPDVPESLRRIVEKCLHRQKEQRFQSGDELADALSLVIREMDEESESPRRRAWPLAVFWPSVLGILTLFVLVTIGGLMASKLKVTQPDLSLQKSTLISRFMADRISEPAAMLAWIDIDESTRGELARNDLQSLVVTDKNGIVVVSHGGPAVGGRYFEPASDPVPGTEGDVDVRRLKSSSGEPSLLVSRELRVNTRPVGSLHISLSESVQPSRGNGALGLLAVMITATFLTVVATTFWFARSLSSSIRTVRDAMAEVANGHYEIRIRDRRSDDMGELYRSFDRMAIALQRKAQGDKETTATDFSKRGES
jgi:HAMP domain-containing protein